MPTRALASVFVALALSMLAGSPALAAPASSVAVFPLEQKTGITQESAELLTDVVVQTLRDAGVFSRVMSAKEIETVLAFNVTKEMASCGNSSCLAEIAGQLGVDFIVAGNVGRFGRAVVMNLRLLDVKTAAAVGSVSRTICGGGEEALPAATRQSTRRLMQAARLATFPDIRATDADQECPPEAPVAAPAVQAAPGTTPVAQEQSSGGRRWLTVGGGGAMAALGAVGGLVGLAGLVTGGLVVFVGFFLALAPLLGSGFMGRVVSFGGTGGALGAAGLVVGLVSLLVGVVGVGVLIGGLVSG
ncbi:MAG: hypothetical protein HY904_09435 [Deltaproteobacteria bacterium]|nr:hypothetical protein [Deltaproteobacteria bacterium]